MSVDEQLLRDMQKHVLGQPGLSITSEGVVQLDTSIRLNEEIVRKDILGANFTCKCDMNNNASEPGWHG